MPTTPAPGTGAFAPRPSVTGTDAYGMPAHLRGRDGALCFVGDVPRGAVWPTVGGTIQRSQEFGDNAGVPRYLRFAVNAIDDVVAGEWLKAEYPSVWPITKWGAPVVLNTDTDGYITRIDVVAVASAESGTLAAGEFVAEASTAASFQTAMVTFNFDAADLVRTAILRPTELYAGAASSFYCRLSVEGRRHA